MISKEKFMTGLLLGLFWVSTSFGFINDEILHADLTTKAWMLCEIVVMIFGLALMRKFTDFLVLATFVIISFISSRMLNHLPWTIYLNGCRDFFGLIFVIPFLRWYLAPERRDRYKALMDRQLYYWLWVQAFCCPWQLIRYGIYDYVGGSMGIMSSGTTSMLIYTVSFYLLVQRWDFNNFTDSLKKNWVYIFLLFPTFLNETKVSFILMLFYFVLLIKFDRRLMIRMAYIIPAGVVGILLLGAVYVGLTGQDLSKFTGDYFYNYLYSEDLDRNIEAAIMLQDGDYDIDPSEWWVEDIPRFAKIALMGPAVTVTPGGVWFGAGVGQFKGLLSDMLTPFARENMWMMQATKPWVFAVFIQMGYIGLIWSLLVLLRNIFIRIGVPGETAVVRRVHLFLLLIFLLLLVYSDTWRLLAFCLVMFYMAMGVRLAVNPYLTKSV